MTRSLLLILCVIIIGIHNHNLKPLIKKSNDLRFEAASLSNNLIEHDTAPFPSKIDRIIEFGKLLLGKPYRYKVSNLVQLDCSGFISYIFSEFEVQLPRISTSIGTYVEPIALGDIKKGDLLFFKGRNIKSNSISHVAMVIAVTNGHIKMMHSCDRGVVIDELESLEYYKKRLIKGGRIAGLVEPTMPINLKFEQDSTIHKNHISPENDSISIMGVGDMMLGSNFPSPAYLAPNDGKDILIPVKGIIEKADIAFGNLEGAILSDNGNAKHCSNPNDCFAFKMPNHYVNYFKEAGFNVLSIANNHIGDFGDNGRDNTVKVLTDASIHFAGLINYPYKTFDKNGIKYGFCAFAPNNGTVCINDSLNAVSIVKHLDSICDIVIVSFHGGAEGASRTHITRKNELFLGENRGNPYKFARTVIDAGADIVFGQGPHVTRAIDIYKGRFIAYSLGNFATYGRFCLKGACGKAPIVNVMVNKRGEFLTGKIYSTKQIGKGGPIIDTEQTALNEIINLTKTDIPECTLRIMNNGLIYKN